jgi:hypothetical protein
MKSDFASKLLPSGRKCKACSEDIPIGRLDLFPDAIYCTRCSETPRIACHTIISGKNEYSQIELVSQEMAESLYAKAKRKGVGVSAGVKFRTPKSQ